MISLDKILKVERGISCGGSPDFIPKKQISNERKLGFYFSEKEFIGYLQGLNELDFPEKLNGQEFEMVIRGVGENKNSQGQYPVFLEQIVNVGNQIHIQAEERKKNNQFYGRFLGYHSFINANNTGFSINEGDYIFGKVTSVKKFNSVLKVYPINIISSERYEKHKNRIF